MVAVIWRLPRRSCAAALAGAVLLAASPQTAAAGASSNAPQVDSLWNQPQGTRVDSAFYVIQAWWDGLTRVNQRDPQQRGLQELAQANEDLLNTYTLLQEQRDNPGPQPVPVVDDFLSGTYAVISGVHIKAPVGSVFGWLNQAALHLEGRGSTDTIVQNLLRDYATQDALATRDLATAADGAAVLAANGARQRALFAKIAAIGAPSSALGPMLAAAQSPAGLGAPAGNAAATGRRGPDPGKSGDPHGKSTEKKPSKP